MIDWVFVLLLMMAFIFVGLSILRDNGFFWNTVFILVSIILFLVLAGGIMDIETPYQMYNATSGNIETGYHHFYKVEMVYLSYLFYMFAVIMVIYNVAYVYMYIGSKVEENRVKDEYRRR